MAAVIGALVLIGIGYFFQSVKIISQGYEALVERLGRYSRKLTPGFSVILFPIELVVFKDTIREQVLDVPPQQCITKDNVSLQADAVVYWRITDMVKTYYAVEDIERALVNLVLTALRSEIGRLELDQTFSSRTEINARLLNELDEATDPWGIKVTRVEVKDINPSRTVQDSMEKQMAAEREKRAAILGSEGKQQARINQAAGEARARVLRAESEKQEKLLRAEGTAEALATIANTLKSGATAESALQFLLAQNYIDMGTTVGQSPSAKVVFVDPASIPATVEGLTAMLNLNSD
ncbi:SPFH domain-containing protein [Synechococcus sp. PCC 7336]|uniref:SPFH domain-containing protein n=1 Tax=Synechococcus sp. PCC 7336 TaxID=195250 RepID=UPI00034AD4FF|nr:SPFH domain-containing protein [Synechococcus sp. PCC 7336]